MSELARALVAELADDPAALAHLRELLRANADDHQEPERASRAAFTVATLATELGVSPKVVRGAIHRGELPAAKRGRCYVIAGEAVAAWATPAAAPAKRRQTPRRLRAPAAAGPSLRSVFSDLESAS